MKDFTLKCLRMRAEGATQRQIAGKMFRCDDGPYGCSFKAGISRVRDQLREGFRVTGATSHLDPRFLIGVAVLQADATWRKKNRECIEAIVEASKRQLMLDVQKYKTKP